MTIEHRIGDVFERLAEIPDGSIDLIVSSPPFLALRSYLPADHPDKDKEIGSEPTPAAFIDTQMALAAEYRRVLAPHGSLCYEIGDTYSGSGGGGGDYMPGGLREGQPGFGGSADKQREGNAAHWRAKNTDKAAWPLAKSMCLIPHAFTMSLAYGRNIITGNHSPAGEWRIRNVICWARSNPPVGALGDKFRPATSYITVACTGPRRYFDLDAVRTAPTSSDPVGKPKGNIAAAHADGGVGKSGWMSGMELQRHPAGAPPLDWHTDNHPEDGDWLWKMSTQPYTGAHYAAFPLTLPKRLIEAMCPQRVCRTCGKPSERVTGDAEYVSNGKTVTPHVWHSGIADSGAHTNKKDGNTTRTAPTLGWTDCGHNDYRTGVTLDPFGGSGTTGAAALAVGRDSILIDLDERNADLARERIGMFLDIIEGPAT